jgi:hypothetical protein
MSSSHGIRNETGLIGKLFVKPAQSSQSSAVKGKAVVPEVQFAITTCELHAIRNHVLQFTEERVSQWRKPLGHPLVKK